MKIAYLIPEFPGQTHNFFWREIAAMRELGITVELFSTQPPPPGLASTSWGPEARKATTYLYPPKIPLACWRVVKMALTRPAHVVNTARSILGTPHVSASTKLRLAALAMLGIQLAEEMKAKGIHHVHVHSCADAANIALYAKLTGGITYSLTLHNPVSVYGSNQANKWQHASFAIVIAKWVWADLQQRLGKSLPKDIRLAPMGVNTDKFTRKSSYQTPAPGQTINIFCCARLNPAKGYLTLFDCIASMIAKGAHPKLVVAGEDDAGGQGYKQVLLKYIADHGLTEHIQLLGAVPEETVMSNLERAHVFALASHEEPLGVAIMEAMSMGIPVVATNTGGIPELIDNGHDGLLVSPKEAEAMCEAISSLLQDPALGHAFSQRGRLKAESTFSHRRSAIAISGAVRDLWS